MTVAVFYYMFTKIVASCLSFSFSPFLTFVSLHGRFPMKSLMIIPKNYFNITLFRSTVVLSKHHTPNTTQKKSAHSSGAAVYKHAACSKNSV